MAALEINALGATTRDTRVWSTGSRYDLFTSLDGDESLMVTVTFQLPAAALRAYTHKNVDPPLGLLLEARDRIADAVWPADSSKGHKAHVSTVSVEQ